MSEKDLKLTDLDYATGDHHLQMMKAALPYLDIRRQRSLSLARMNMERDRCRSSLSGYQTAAVSLHVHPCQGDDAHHGIFPGER